MSNEDEIFDWLVQVTSNPEPEIEVGVREDGTIAYATDGTNTAIYPPSQSNPCT